MAAILAAAADGCPGLGQDGGMPEWDADQLAQLASSLPADYAALRFQRVRTAVHTRRDTQPQADVDHDDVGVGVRVLLDGCWGYAATDDLSEAGVRSAAERALALARVAAPTTLTPVVLADEPRHVGEWASPHQVDPFSLTARDRADFLTWGCDRLLSADGVDHTEGHVMAVREDTRYADSAGTRTTQRRVRVHAEFSAITVTSSGFESMRTIAPPAGRGWEYVTTDGPHDWAAELAELPAHLAAKAQAPSVEPGTYTLVLHPSNLWLTIHESVGHATELDRIRGYEANYAGTSFVGSDDLGQLRYGSPHMNVRADRVEPHGLATVAWDDEGVAAQDWSLITDGTLVDVQLDRAMAATLGRRSNGCAYADSAAHVPIQRMPNVSLQPDPEGGDLDSLIAGVDDGILVVGDGSWSIDMQRYNFQFTGQRFERIRAGRRAGPLRDVAYQGRTPSFWGSLAAVGGPETYELGGAVNCGKGQPGQVAPVSHGCPAAVFDGVNILNSAQEAG
ncbi:MAG: TldD/PmbA family protein [Candidatus Nanopelagicales bacterium]